MREAFALQKLLTFFNKNIGVFKILMFEVLTKRSLTTSLVLNNWAQHAELGLYCLLSRLSREQCISFCNALLNMPLKYFHV